MKRNTIIITVVALFAGLVAGCGDSTSSKYIAEVEKMDTTNAPILGPVYKEFMIAVLSKDGEKAWDLMSKDGKKTYEDEFNAIDKAKLKEQLEELKKADDKLPTGDTPIPQETLDKMKEAKEAQIKMLEVQLEAENAKDYFINQMSMVIEMALAIEDEKEEGEKKGLETEFVSEKIEGDKGYVVTKDKESGHESKMHFVKEDGKWKLDMTK